MSRNPFVDVIVRGLDFQGRTSRASFWMVNAPVAVIVTYFIFTTTLEPAQWNAGIQNYLHQYPLLAIPLLIAEVCLLSLFVRRLHDVNHSGWWLLLNWTVVGAFIPLFWSFRRGTRGRNRFGDDPLSSAKSRAATSASFTIAEPADPMSRLDQLKELGELHESGVLSDAEFSSEKRLLLSVSDSTIEQATIGQRSPLVRVAGEKLKAPKRKRNILILLFCCAVWACLFSLTIQALVGAILGWIFASQILSGTSLPKGWDDGSATLIPALFIAFVLSAVLSSAGVLPGTRRPR